MLTIEDMANGGNQKVIDAITAGPDHKKSGKLIRSLRRLNLEHTDFEYLKSLLMPLTHGYFPASTATNIQEPIYRAVRCPEEKPYKISELGCPPPEKVKLGRANTPGNPVFYGSAGCHSTIMELAPNLGDRLAISKWRTKTNLHLICAGYTAEAFSAKTGLNRFESLPWVKHHASDPLSQKQGNQLIHEFIAHEFTKKVLDKEAWNYKISAAINELILNAKSFGLKGAPAIEIAGIVYPSSPNEGNADNVALKCEIAAEHLEFVHVQYIKISRKSDGPAYSMLGLDFANSLSVDGTIEWHNAYPSDRIAGTDHTVRPFADRVEIVDNKNVVVGTFPTIQTPTTAS